MAKTHNAAASSYMALMVLGGGTGSTVHYRLITYTTTYTPSLKKKTKKQQLIVDKIKKNSLNLHKYFAKAKYGLYVTCPHSELWPSRHAHSYEKDL